MEDEQTKLLIFENMNVVPVADRGELLRKLKDKDEVTLRIEAAVPLEGVTANTRTAVSMAQMELDRRNQIQSEKLASKTTWISAIVGAVSAIVGAIVGALLGG